jgi:hypothetical protein
MTRRRPPDMVGTDAEPIRMSWSERMEGVMNRVLPVVTGGLLLAVAAMVVVSIGRRRLGASRR